MLCLSYPMPGRPRKLCKCEKREESPELGRQEALWGEGEQADSRTTAAGRAVRVSLSRRQAEEWDVTWQVSVWWGNFWVHREACGVRPGLVLALLPAGGPWQISVSL